MTLDQKITLVASVFSVIAVFGALWALATQRWVDKLLGRSRTQQAEIDALARMLDQKQDYIDRIASRVSGVHSDVGVLRGEVCDMWARQQRRDPCSGNPL
jgi:hypothetical protein